MTGGGDRWKPCRRLPTHTHRGPVALVSDSGLQRAQFGGRQSVQSSPLTPSHPLQSGGPHSVGPKYEI